MVEVQKRRKINLKVLAILAWRREDDNFLSSEARTVQIISLEEVRGLSGSQFRNPQGSRKQRSWDSTARGRGRR